VTVCARVERQIDLSSSHRLARPRFLRGPSQGMGAHAHLSSRVLFCDSDPKDYRLSLPTFPLLLVLPQLLLRCRHGSCQYGFPKISKRSPALQCVEAPIDANATALLGQRWLTYRGRFALERMK